MNTYQVTYYTLSKGKSKDHEVGNLLQFHGIAYIYCTDTTKVKGLLEEFYKFPKKSGVFYVPVIESIKLLQGDCIVEGE